MKKIYVLSLVVLTFILVGCGKKDNLVKYESDLIGFDFSNYVISSSGEIDDDYADIVFEIPTSKFDEFDIAVSDKISRISKEEFNGLIGTNLYNRFAIFCDGGDMVQLYQTFRSGSVVKTRDIYALSCYKDNKYYFNIIG